MSHDELSEINGVKPNVWLTDGEEREVSSATSKSKYKMKRTFDHFYCSCPAWRNQSGIPINARTCKHLKALLGNDYEAARIASKNPDSHTPKDSKIKSKAASNQAKPLSKRKRNELEDGSEEREDNATLERQEEQKSTRPASKRSKIEPVNEDVEIRPPQEESRVALKVAKQGYDELSEINGIKPEILLRDGEEREVGSATNKNKYKVKRTLDHYYCSCPAWRNQARTPVDARSCKHLKTLLGEAYEDARLQPRISGRVSDHKPTSKGKPPPGAKTLAKEKHSSDVSDEANEDVELGNYEGEDRNEFQGTDEKTDGHGADASSDGDELMEINGVKPNIYMEEGDEREVGSFTSNSKYKIKRTWDHYYCSCPAWRNQGGLPVNARSCKHLKSLLGEEYEQARLLWKNPNGPQPTSSRGKGKAKGTHANGGEEPPALLLANKWELDDGPNPAGWWISEKLDGVRTYFDGKKMISRLGNPFTPPQWFLDEFPKDVTLDGELFGGRGEFQSTVSIVKNCQFTSLEIYHFPGKILLEPFEVRLAFLKELFGPGGSYQSERILVVEHEQARDRQHVLDKLKEVESLGGEGLMLRKPQSLYEGHRSSTLLKIKTFYDAEAIVVGYIGGKGKHKGATGALKCKMASGKSFNVGTGLSDKQRRSPPEIGTIIVYRFQELTRDGVPRFPSFVGIAVDKEEPKDAEIPEHRRNGAKPSDD